MPTAPNPGSQYMDARLQSMFGARTPGSPMSAGKPGLQMGKASFPNPPGVATGVQGKPASPSPAPGGGFTFPAPPKPPEQSAKGQVIDRAQQVGGQVIDRVTDGQVIDRGNAAQPNGQNGQQQTTPPVDTNQGQQSNVGGQVIDRVGGQVIDRVAPPILTNVPNPQQLAQNVPGTPIQSPIGTTVQDPITGAATTTLSPEGQMKYQQAIVAKRKAFGPMPRVMAGIPGLPPPPVKIGKMGFNPFSGSFTE